MRNIAGLATVTLAAIALLTPISATAATDSAANPAYWPPAAAGFVSWRGEGIRIYSCASQGCSVVGLGYSSHAAGWYCGEVANGLAHIWDDTTQVDGWVSTSWIYYGCD